MNYQEVHLKQTREYLFHTMSFFFIVRVYFVHQSHRLVKE